MSEKGEDATAWSSRKWANPIITKYRFCNIIREDDRVTKFIFEWARHWDGDADQWFALVVGRLFNLPGTLALITASVVPFNVERMRTLLHSRRGKGLKIFNAAYIVSTNGVSMDKVDYVLDIVLTPIWNARMALRPKRLSNGDRAASSRLKTLSFESWNSWHSRLQSNRGMGSFMSAQVVADLKYCPPFYDRVAKKETGVTRDWWTFAASGPGSRRGLNRVLGKLVEASWTEKAWRAALVPLHAEVLSLLPAIVGGRLTAQNLQNTLCEFDKFERARLGQGKPKQLYTPHKEK